MAKRGQANSSRPRLHRGPLSGLSVTAQWIGVAVAVIVACVGVRHVYVEIAEPPRVVSLVEHEQIPETDLAEPTVEEIWFERPEETSPEVEPQPAGAMMAFAPAPAPAPALAPAPESQSPAAKPIVVYRSVPEGPPEQVVREESLVDRLRASLGDLQELTDTPALESEEKIVEEVAPDPFEQAEATRVTGPPDSNGGVVVVSLRWNGRDTPASIRAGLEHDVTLVTIGKDGGRGSAPTPVGAPPDAPEASVAGSGIYYFRLFAGSTVDSLEPDSHGLLGEDLSVLPSREASPWTGLLSKNESMRGFDVPSMVALDPVWLPAQQTHAQSDFVAAVGGQLYEVSVSGVPSGYDGWHEMKIEIASRFPDRTSRNFVELQILVQQNQFVVLRAPGVSPPARFPDFDRAFINTILVAFTPISSPEVDTIGAMDLMFEDDPRVELIPVEGPQPVLPVGFPHGPATLGDLRLRVLVLISGEPISVIAIDAATPDGEYLVEPIVSAVRQWRFHPPALDPMKIGGYFEITVRHDGEIVPDSFNLASEPR